MYRLSVNERETNSVGDTYANAILRTLSSLKPPPSPTLLLHSKHHRSHTKTVPQSVINEVSGFKTCLYSSTNSRNFFSTRHFLTLSFKCKLMDRVSPFSFRFSSSSPSLL